jgi:proteasome assembly chaperone 3
MATSSLSAGLQGISLDAGVEISPFPVPTKHAAGLVNGTQTEVSSMYFADKIVVTISQGGRLSQWVCVLYFYHYSPLTSEKVHVPLSSASPTSFDTALPSEDSDMLPLGHLTPKTLLGAGGDQRETIGHLYASQIASAIATKNPEDTRTVLVGIGLQKLDLGREAFFDLIEMVHKVL